MEEKNIHHTADGPDALPDALRMNPYTVPDGYFKGLTPLVLQRCNATADPSKAWPIPSGYFEQLEANITGKIAEQQLKESVSDPGFAVPEHYFEHLAERSLAEASLRERIADPGYSVPAPYFDNLQHVIASRMQPVREDVIPVRKLRKPSWLLYAAAACLALFLTTWGIFNRLGDGQASDSSLASVPEQEIFNYLELYGSAEDIVFISEQLDDAGERNIGNGLSEADIEAYLNHTL